MATYLLGYAAGYELADVVGDNKFYVEENYTEKVIVNGRVVKYIPRHRTKMYKTAEAAEKRARQGQQESNELNPKAPAAWFWHAMPYNTDIKKHAKGLKPWLPEHEGIHWVGQRLVEVLPDPATLIKALSHTR